MNAIWKDRNPRERILLLLCVAIAIVAVFLVVSPTGGSSVNLLPAAEAKRQFRDTANQVAALQKERGQLEPEITKLVYDKSPEQVLPDIIRALQGIAKASGVHLREIKPLRVKRMGALTKVPVSVRFTTGDFSRTVVPFIYRAEDPANRLVVDKLTVASTDPKARTVDVEVQIALFTRSKAVVSEDT